MPWQVEIVPPGDPTNRLNPPLKSSPEAAAAYCLTYLENALAQAVPAEPDQAVGVPQSPARVAVGNPTPLITRLAHHHAGQPVTVHLDRTGCRLYLHERDRVRQIARADTLAAALTALRVPDDGESGLA